jgi:hypothetical protein
MAIDLQSVAGDNFRQQHKNGPTQQIKAMLKVK